MGTPTASLEEDIRQAQLLHHQGQHEQEERLRMLCFLFRAQLLHHQGQHEQAQSLYRSVLERNPLSYPILCLLGDSLVASGNEPEALAHYERAMKLNPGHALACTRADTLRFRKTWGPMPTPLPRHHYAPCLQMSTLGANGRFGNQLFQYAFARRYAETHGLELAVSDWIGRDLFELYDALPDSLLPTVGENTLQPDAFTLMADPVPSPQLMDRDLNGYFMPHTSKWCPHNDAFRSWFQPGTRIKPGLDGIVARLRSNGRTLVALHLRRGDFGYSDFWVAPNSWYLRALDVIWPTLDQPVLYIATDDPATRQAFSRFNPIKADPQSFSLAVPDYFIDHYILSKADLLMISNSTFSFTAAMLNKGAQATFRPDPATQSMVAFSPWNAPVGLSAKETVEPVLPVLQKFIEQLVQAQDTVMHYGRFCAPWTNAVRATRPALRVFELEASEPLDAARTQLGLNHIQHLAIDDTAYLPAFLAGAAKTLHFARIDFVHITVRPGSANLEALTQLQAAGFRLFVLADAGVYPVQPTPVDVVTGVLAINERIVPFLLKQESKEMIDIAQQCAKHSITPRGVIHVGAHEGKEVGSYEDMGSTHVLYIEANPSVYERLQANIESRDNKRAKISMLNRAVSDAPGTLELHLASFDQSSSLLPMGLHREIYPQVQPSGRISVQASRLDDVMVEQGLALTDFNILNIDVQGAEAMVLRGAPEVLAHVEAVNVKINFAELYQGGAMIEDVEGIMQAAGFHRVALSCPYHPTWGDALYVKQRTA